VAGLVRYPQCLMSETEKGAALVVHPIHRPYVLREVLGEMASE